VEVGRKNLSIERGLIFQKGLCSAKRSGRLGQCLPFEPAPPSAEYWASMIISVIDFPAKRGDLVLSKSRQQVFTCILVVGRSLQESIWIPIGNDHIGPERAPSVLNFAHVDCYRRVTSETRCELGMGSQISPAFFGETDRNHSRRFGLRHGTSKESLSPPDFSPIERFRSNTDLIEQVTWAGACAS